MRHLQSCGHGAILAATLLALSAPQAAVAVVTPAVPGKACERTQVRRLLLSDAARPDTLTVRATGRSCSAARIVVTLRSAAGRRLWSEASFLSSVEFGRFPDEPAPEVTFEAVIGAVENWVSIEQASDAPPWPGLGPRPGDAPLGPLPPGEAAYDTKLDRARYERIRADHARMLCIPIGPESAHCIAKDPSSGRFVEFLGRGV